LKTRESLSVEEREGEKWVKKRESASVVAAFPACCAAVNVNLGSIHHVRFQHTFGAITTAAARGRSVA
jgi:hypothetical protein